MAIIQKLWWFFKLEKRRYLIGIIALSLVSVLNLIPPKAMGTVIDQITTKQLTQSQLLLFNFIALILSAFGMYALRYIWRMYILGTSYRLGRLLRGRLFAHFTRMSPSFYQKYRTGDLMAHATNDINALTMLAGGGVMSAVDASVTALVTIVTMVVSISWQMTLIALLPMPFMAYATSRIGRKNHASFHASQAAFSQLNNAVQESVSGMRVTKSFGYATQESQTFSKINQHVFERNMIAMKYNALFDPVTLVFVGASYALTLLVGWHLVANGQLSIGKLVTFVTYLDMLVWPLKAVGFVFNISQRGNVSYDRIEALLKEESDIQETDTPIEPIENGRLEYAIEQFAYDETQTLQDIHFAIEKGQTLGIVGPTGAGKTTLLKLLLRERDSQKGTIFLNGHAIQAYRLADLRGLIGYVPQDQLLFAMTIGDNIRFANPQLSQEAVERAAQLCGVYDDIIAMPQGFDTLIGERGVSLSGGQKQRIAMSRALVMNPDILILDDSLSAVDAKTEHLIIENLKQNRQNQTTLITAHRLSAVVHADLIIVMQDGRIVERGTHDELLAQKGWYYTTYQAQQLEEEEATYA